MESNKNFNRHTLIQFERKGVTRTVFTLGTTSTGSFRAIDLNRLSSVDISVLRSLFDDHARRYLTPETQLYLKQLEDDEKINPGVIYKRVIKQLLPSDCYRCFKPSDITKSKFIHWNEVLPQNS